ncbi:amidohydrolase [Bacillus canaveralius]|uniref:Amidohydrolase n=1 Tax=Bacillus canaveralius TaxID=1403243 RepID=A0A2N5GLL6_9BACI|nr:amidohydrolase [Bacillus canaveralius]PLR82533.1 amidohydrolase [Bacillus canaveralius]PLR95704.1 amidohydrolase [Bacillus canaveralius]
MKGQISLLEEAKKLESELIAWRRDFHQYPELGFEENRTSALVADFLESLNLEVKRNVAGTGVIGLLRGNTDGPTIALRADIDALPIFDEKDTEYCSKNEGKCHACGHDAHTAILMGVAKLLSDQGIKKGNVKFVFQPAEEDGGGAQAMIEAGVLQNPEVSAIAGLHVNTGIGIGNITLSSEPVGCGAADFFSLAVIGQGGHAAHPHMSVDSIAVAGQLLSALQHISSRQVDPTDPIVITVGSIHGGTASNVIAPRVEMTGTARTLNPELRKRIPGKMEKIIKGVTEAYGASYDFDFQFKYPSILNDEQMTELAAFTADQVLGEKHYKKVKPAMGGEDFSFYTELIPAVFFRLGVGSDKIVRYPGHHPKFDIDEKALPYGSAMLAQLALNYLNR